MSQSSIATALEISPIGAESPIVPANVVLIDRPYEFIDCAELASRLKLPVLWIREQVKTRPVDPIPSVDCCLTSLCERFSRSGFEL